MLSKKGASTYTIPTNFLMASLKLIKDRINNVTLSRKKEGKYKQQIKRPKYLFLTITNNQSANIHDKIQQITVTKNDTPQRNL